MTILSFARGYIVCADDHMVCHYNTLSEANDHIRHQKEEMHSKAYWSILHVKDYEWIKPLDR